MEFQLPDRMYKLPLIQKSNVTTISNPSVEVRNFLDGVHVSVLYIHYTYFKFFNNAGNKMRKKR